MLLFLYNEPLLAVHQEFGSQSSQVNLKISKETYNILSC